MREITPDELEAMTSSQLEAALHEQEQSLRDLAVAEGFCASAPRDEFTAWAGRTQQGRNIDLLTDAIRERDAGFSSIALRRVAYIAVAFVLIAVFMWLKAWA